MRARSAPGSRPAAPCAPAPFSEARATASDALKAQPAGDDALALVLAEGSGDHRPQIHVLRAETPARHAGVVPPREEAAALENDRVASGKSQADVHARSIHGPCQPGGAVMHGLSCAAGIPCAAGVPSRDARARVLAHSGRGERVRRPARRNQPPRVTLACEAVFYWVARGAVSGRVPKSTFVNGRFSALLRTPCDPWRFSS